MNVDAKIRRAIVERDERGFAYIEKSDVGERSEE